MLKWKTGKKNKKYFLKQGPVRGSFSAGKPCGGREDRAHNGVEDEDVVEASGNALVFVKSKHASPQT